MNRRNFVKYSLMSALAFIIPQNKVVADTISLKEISQEDFLRDFKRFSNMFSYLYETSNGNYEKYLNKIDRLLEFFKWCELDYEFKVTTFYKPYPKYAKNLIYDSVVIEVRSTSKDAHGNVRSTFFCR